MVFVLQFNWPIPNLNFDQLTESVKTLFAMLHAIVLKEKEKQVTRGHNIVADGWAGASNPHPHP